MDDERIELLPAPVASTDCRTMLAAAAAIIVFTFVVLGGWSAVAHIDSAVVADGTVAVESSRKLDQLPFGASARQSVDCEENPDRSRSHVRGFDPTPCQNGSDSEIRTSIRPARCISSVISVAE